MITAYNKRLNDISFVEHAYMLKPANEWVINPLISDLQALRDAPKDRWVYDPETTKLGLLSDDEYDSLPSRVKVAQQSRMSLMSTKSSELIVLGFSSNALGDAHWYDGSITDQLNLLGALAASAPTTASPGGVSMFLACRDGTSDNEKEYEPHTANQIKQVLNDGVLYRSAVLQKFSALCALIKAATKVSEVNKITWDSL